MRVRCLLWALLLLAAGVAPASAGDTGYRLPVWPHVPLAPDFALTDTTGHARTLADYRGRIVLLFFGYARCPDVCPTTLYRLKLALKQSGVDQARLQVLFVSLDPEHDSPALLDSYVHAFGPQFAALTGSTPQVDAAARAFFVQYARVPQGNDYTIDHSASVLVIDAAGRLRLIARPGAPVDDIAHDLRLLSAQSAG